MSISIDNELDRLLSLVSGGNWVRASLARLSSDGLKSVASLAESNAENAASQLMKIGSVLGRGGLENDEVSALGWITKDLAEKAEVCNTLAAFAREFENPELRSLHMQIIKDGAPA